MLNPGPAAGAIIACSAAMIKAVELARRLAPLPRPLLLVGQSGVGKGLLARFIHVQSARAGAFVAVAGGELSASLLHDRLITRLGAERELPLDCRVVLASNQPLEVLVSSGRLLSDLRWRIGEFVVEIP